MIKILAVGDVFITKLLPEKDYVGFKKIQEIIKMHDVRFANLESTFHNKEGYPSLFPGGTYAMSNPLCLKDLKKYGFNVFSLANNHSMDYSHNGLLATIANLNREQMLFAGIGENLAAASQPAYLDCINCRVALIACTSSFHDSDSAGNQGIDMMGRPGINPLKHKSVYEVTPVNYQYLEKIAFETGINDYHNQAIKEGYLHAKENLTFGCYEFKKGSENKLITTPDNIDKVRILNSIAEAKKQADIVVVSIHGHQFKNNKKEIPPDFMRIFAKECIDAGAQIIIGHGPHEIRGIELYKNGVIFYGLGNFIFENETVSHLPAEFYEKYNIKDSQSVGAAMDKRSKNNTIGLALDSKAYNSIMPSIMIKDGKIESIEIYSLELGFHLPRSLRGKPIISDDISTLEHLKELSSLFDTKITVINNKGKVLI